MHITVGFHDLSLEDAQKVIEFSINHLGLKVAEVLKEPELKPARRRRRTKVEMAEARNNEARAAEADNPVEPGAEPEAEEEPKRRRRRRPAVADTEAEVEVTKAEEKPRRRRRRSAPEDPTSARAQTVSSRRRRTRDVDSVEQDPAGDEITDRDVSKAASEGAQELTPAAVRGILDQFGVSNVADLDQGQRREFINLINQAIADAGLDDEIPF